MSVKRLVMSEIAQNISQLKTRIPQQVKLVAVSKTKSAGEIREAMHAGQMIFGENKVQELVDKYGEIPEAQWHFIGHLQTNKVKYLVPFVAMIHGVDSFRVLEEIDKQAQKYGRVIDCLLQIHIAEEETKFGFTPEEAQQLLENPERKKLHHVRLCGLMGVATFTEDKAQVRKEFHGLARLFQEIKQKYFSEDHAFCELSMGMSDDYMIAIEEGSTIVRIGSAIFGQRYYQ